MRIAGLSNAIVGLLASDGIKLIFTAPQNMHATKAAISFIASKNQTQ